MANFGISSSYVKVKKCLGQCCMLQLDASVIPKVLKVP